jgi:hypothetical protein
MKTINDLRATLFDTLAAIKSGTLDIDRAKAINDVAKTIINSAKVQIAYSALRGDTPYIPFLDTAKAVEPEALESA